MAVVQFVVVGSADLKQWILLIEYPINLSDQSSVIVDRVAQKPNAKITFVMSFIVYYEALVEPMIHSLYIQ